MNKSDAYKWAIIALAGTVIIHVSFFVVLGTTELKGGNIPDHVTIDFAAEIDDVISEDDNESETTEKYVNPLTGEVENRTINSTQKTVKTNQNMSSEDIEAELAQKYADLEKEYLGDNSASSKAKAEYEKKLEELKKQNARLHDENSTAKHAVDGGEGAGAVTMDANVEGRRILRDKKPSYMCIKSGTVYMEIKVRQTGVVFEAKIDESKTNTFNECLRMRAVEYAKMCKFNEDFGAPRVQDGYIVYTYSAQ